VRSRTRSTQLIERANDEAQAILTRARAEAEDIVARARTEVPAVEQLVEQLERDRRQFRSVLYSTISNLLAVLTVARRDGNGEQAPLRGRLEGKVVEAVVQPGVSEGEAAPQPSLDVERTSDVDPVEHLKAMLRGIDSTLGKIPALPRE
jgi:cell division septum initiation protein DivIVA